MEKKNNKVASQSSLANGKVPTLSNNLTIRIAVKRAKLGSHLYQSVVPKVNYNSYLNNREPIQGSDWLSKRITKVEPIDNDGYHVVLNTGKAYDLMFDGRSCCYNKNGIRSSELKIHYDNNGSRPRVTVFDNKGKQVSIFMERAILIVHSVYNNLIPYSIHGLQCNVKDCSGNINTVYKLGLAGHNFHPDNLEWVDGSKNSAHDDTVFALKRKLGKVYGISAKDTVLQEILGIGTNSQIERYLVAAGYNVAE